MKNKETLEEVAERISKSHSVYETGQDDFHQGFITGAKWQQEQDKNKYSEEDMKSFADWVRNGLLNIEYSVYKLDKHLQQWEQFKKK